MTGIRDTRVLPLTTRFYLAYWVGRHYLHASAIRAHIGGRTRIIGFAASVLGHTIALGVFAGPCGATRGRYKDFGGPRTGLYTIGVWRTRRCVPVSTGWVRGGGNSRIGITLTLASRTLLLAKLATRADMRASREHHGDLHRKATR